jgi:hypothetical protein
VENFRKSEKIIGMKKGLAGATHNPPRSGSSLATHTLPIWVARVKICISGAEKSTKNLKKI